MVMRMRCNFLGQPVKMNGDRGAEPERQLLRKCIQFALLVNEFILLLLLLLDIVHW